MIHLLTSTAYRTEVERDFGKQALEDYQAARIANGLKAQEGILFVDDPEEAKKVSVGVRTSAYRSSCREHLSLSLAL